MSFLSKIPIYIWPLLVYIIFVGIKSRKDYIVFTPKLFILPVIFLSKKLNYILSLEYYKLLIMIVLLIITISYGYLSFSKKKIEIVKKLTIKCPGEPYTLVITLLFFVIKFFIGFSMGMFSENIKILLDIDLLLTIFFSGYFLGKAIFCFRKSI